VKRPRKPFTRGSTQRLVNGHGFTTARLNSREIFNDTIRLKQQGYNHTEIQREVDRNDFLRNNNCAVVRKALQTWDSYQSLLDWWREQNDPDGGEQADTTKHGQVWCVPARLPSRECERTAKGITKASDRVTVPEAVYWVHLPVSLPKISSIKRGTCLWTQTNDYRSF